jgi:hypothetical protein
LADVWTETFPNSKQIAKTKIGDRKERAKVVKDLELKMKEMTPEEMDAYWESIPEWKRGALVVQNADGEVEEEAEGVRHLRKRGRADRLRAQGIQRDKVCGEGAARDCPQSGN